MKSSFHRPDVLLISAVAIAIAANLFDRNSHPYVSSFQVQLPRTRKVISPAYTHTSALFDRPIKSGNARTVTGTSFTQKIPTLETNSQLFSTSNDIENETKKAEDEGVGAWFPLASTKGLTGLGPQRVTIMGLDLVVWHTEADEKKGEKMMWSAQVDACAHRLAPLSQGRVDPKTNCVECPYHGWQFDTDGMVNTIPQLDEKRTVESIQKANGNVKTFPVHPVGDLLFVFLPSSLHGEMFPQSILPEQFYPDLDCNNPVQQEQFFVRDLPYSFDFLVENFMDPAHIPFAHHKLQSTRDDGSPIEMSVLVNNFTNVEVSFTDISAKRERDAYASFQRPCYYHYGEYVGEGIDEATGKKGREPKLRIFLVPVSAGKSRVFLPCIPIPKWVPFRTALLHAGSNRFLNSDTWLHDTEREVVRRKEAGAGNVNNKLAQMDYIVASRSDTGVSVFRKWWEENGLAKSPRNTFRMSSMEELGPITLSRREQIDPWDNHAKHCSECRKALKSVKRIQMACLVGTIGSTVLVSSHPIFGILGIGSTLYGRNFLKRVATTIEGNPERSEVCDRSAAAIAD